MLLQGPLAFVIRYIVEPLNYEMTQDPTNIILWFRQSTFASINSIAPVLQTKAKIRVSSLESRTPS